MPHSLTAISTLVAHAAERQVRLVPTEPLPAEAATVVEPAAAVRDALAQPLEFPPLAQGTVPGDHVAIAVDRDVPCAVDIVRGAIDACLQAGVERDAISVVAPTARFGRLLRDRLENRHGCGVRLVVHDPADPYDLCPIGVTDRKEPLLVNRTLYDADIVLPVGCARLIGRGVYSSLYPQFSSAESIRRYRQPAERQRYAQPGANHDETDQAGWLLGVPLVIQVVPGRDGSVMNVLAGEPTAVARRGQELCRQHWSFRAARRVSLVVATVSGDAQAQRWDDIGRAVAAAEPLLEDGGGRGDLLRFQVAARQVARPAQGLHRPGRRRTEVAARSRGR